MSSVNLFNGTENMGPCRSFSAPLNALKQDTIPNNGLNLSKYIATARGYLFMQGLVGLPSRPPSFLCSLQVKPQTLL